MFTNPLNHAISFFDRANRSRLTAREDRASLRNDRRKSLSGVSRLSVIADLMGRLVSQRNAARRNPRFRYFFSPRAISISARFLFRKKGRDSTPLENPGAFGVRRTFSPRDLCDLREGDKFEFTASFPKRYTVAEFTSGWGKGCCHSARRKHGYRVGEKRNSKGSCYLSPILRFSDFLRNVYQRRGAPMKR